MLTKAKDWILNKIRNNPTIAGAIMVGGTAGALSGGVLALPGAMIGAVIGHNAGQDGKKAE